MLLGKLVNEWSRWDAQRWSDMMIKIRDGFFLQWIWKFPSNGQSVFVIRSTQWRRLASICLILLSSCRQILNCVTMPSVRSRQEVCVSVCLTVIVWMHEISYVWSCAVLLLRCCFLDHARSCTELWILSSKVCVQSLKRVHILLTFVYRADLFSLWLAALV